jgi:hypothetical protein
MIGKKRANSYKNNAASLDFFGEYLKARWQKTLDSSNKLYVL